MCWMVLIVLLLVYSCLFSVSFCPPGRSGITGLVGYKEDVTGSTIDTGHLHRSYVLV